MQLQGKKILLGVTGSIAAYKAAHLTRLLIKEGAEVQIIMSTSALDFITPLTLSTLSKKPVLHTFYDPKTGSWNNHVELGLWADLFLVAPISAHTISKFAQGTCDNLLAAAYLSARCKIMVAPAMDLDMYQHPSVKTNLDTLSSYGNIILEAEEGELASGLSGQGRLMEPEHIVEKVVSFFDKKKDLTGKEVLLTAGPTNEAIDPVRFIGNHSSGKMGIAIAYELAEQGALVNLILGPSHIPVDHPLIKVFKVSSASEMYQSCQQHHLSADICIFAAAVADYTPETVATEKIKKSEDEIILKLKKNVDIAASLGKVKAPGQIHIGFALETQNEEINALSKLKNKNFDMVVLNSMRDSGAGFQHDTNKVTFYFKNGDRQNLALLSKKEVAAHIVTAIKSLTPPN
ncbi:bifunctional phosphopantothenoylcysteine decarboxylase/phosphopantothenate--cysteine ligase CoaBC [Anditalea andensis]|uniref:Coenzyme A biosynthesis bifunctional protein CoaBC n=1 Tax=Anditalea andensis TaxID=1048983 RepID=A0A074L517_9BACT|nr:bifunctional phosphopantothenoylcysteine decarboxylase/phosphopantothenate--cysteine ligase CoaBC [Anditalea andensis]KEO74938.1 phosphopantothenoylcysteine decarboxylase [Anditalea andensis]